MAVSAKQAALAERRAKVIAQRVERVPFAEIAAGLGISDSTARADYRRALAEVRAERNALADLGHSAELASLDVQEAAVWKVLRNRHVSVHAGKVVTRLVGWERAPDTGAIERDGEGNPIGIYEEIEDDAPVLEAVDRLGKIDDRRAARGRRSSATLEAAMRQQIDGMAEQVRASPLAQMAIRLAAEIDAGLSPRDTAALTRELRLTVLRLEELSPAKGEKDVVDELADRRNARLADAAAR